METERMKFAKEQLKIAKLDEEFHLMPLSPVEQSWLFEADHLTDVFSWLTEFLLSKGAELGADYYEYEFMTYSLTLVFKKDPIKPPKKTNGNHKSDNGAQLVGETANVGMNSQSERQKLREKYRE